jgi:hypothetical protein
MPRPPRPSRVALSLGLVACAAGLAGCNDKPKEHAAEPSPVATAGGAQPRIHVGPKESADACDGKSPGEACTLVIGDRSIAGRCASPAPGVSDTRLTCRPVPPPALFDACNGKDAGAECSVVLGKRSMRGTCTAPPPGDPEARLGCRPGGSAPAHGGH